MFAVLFSVPNKPLSVERHVPLDIAMDLAEFLRDHEIATYVEVWNEDECETHTWWDFKNNLWIEHRESTNET